MIFDKTGDRIGGERLEQVVTVKSGEKDRLFRLPALADCASIPTVPMRIMTALEDWESSSSQEVSDWRHQFTITWDSLSDGSMKTPFETALECTERLFNVELSTLMLAFILAHQPGGS